jgi:regulator of cell morphogenesis and NO signaling
MTAKTVREIALEQPSSVHVFEELGIDYCCGGRKPLAEACAANHLEVTAVISALETAAAEPAKPTVDWSSQSLESLCAHIISTHHAFVRRELPRLEVLADKVVTRHGMAEPELARIMGALGRLDEELLQHLAKEERVLFPYIAALERAQRNGNPKPYGGFANVGQPIALMTKEHDEAGGLMAEMRRLSHQFTPPVEACPTYQALYFSLREFEQDLHQHIHLENNILFPRAIALEAAAN